MNIFTSNRISISIPQSFPIKDTTRTSAAIELKLFIFAKLAKKPVSSMVLITHLDNSFDGSKSCHPKICNTTKMNYYLEKNL